MLLFKFRFSEFLADIVRFIK